MVAREDQDVICPDLLDLPQLLAYGIGRALTKM
jgi:hypothetical protein